MLSEARACILTRKENKRGEGTQSRVHSGTWPTTSVHVLVTAVTSRAQLRPTQLIHTSWGWYRVGNMLGKPAPGDMQLPSSETGSLPVPLQNKEDRSNPRPADRAVLLPLPNWKSRGWSCGQIYPLLSPCTSGAAAAHVAMEGQHRCFPISRQTAKHQQDSATGPQQNQHEPGT